MTTDAVRGGLQVLAAGKFLVAYLAVLVMPGPNMLAIGGIAALRGFRAAIPFCFGIAAGAGTLAASLFSAGLVIPMNDFGQIIARIVSALLLLALRAASLPSSRLTTCPSKGRARRSSHLAWSGSASASSLRSRTQSQQPISQPYSSGQ